MLVAKSKLKIIPSFRFQNEKKAFFQNRIFLPFELSDKSIFLKNLQILVDANKIKNLNKYEVKIHPLGLKLKDHIQFADKVKNVIKKSKNSKIKKNNKSSVFFGQTTAIIVALELNFKCYHVCSYPLFDSYSSKLWSSIKVKKLSENLFEYELIRKNSFIQKGSNNEKIF